MDGLVQLVPLVGILLVFWLLIIRPQQRRAREQMSMQRAVEVGDQVILTSGFYGEVVSLDDDRVQVELSPGVVVTVARPAIGGVVPDEEPDAEHDPDTTPDEAEPAGPTLEKKSEES